MGKLLWEAIQRSTTGPMMTEEKFETELFPTVLGDLQKKYRIEFDPDEPAMIDPELADAIFEAGKELLLEVGLLCKDTQRIIKFSQEEIEEAILTARHEVTVGHGREAITLSPRAPGDRQHPYCFNAAGIITTDTQLYKQHAMTVMQEPTCDGVIPMPLFGIGGMKNIAGTPMQTQVCLTEARIMNEAAAWAGKPGLFFGIPMTSTTPHTLISTFASGLYNRHNCTLPVQILQDMRVDYDRFNLAFYADQLGLEPWMSSSPTLYAYITGPEQGAMQIIAHTLGMLAYSGGALTQAMSVTVDGVYTGNDVTWCNSAAALAAHAHTAAYAASKHGLLALSESLARELAAMGSPVRVSVVFPGAVRTGIARELVADAGNATLPINRLLVDLATKGAEPQDVVRQVLREVEAGTFAIFPQTKVRDRASERLKTLLGGKLPVG